MWSFFFRNRWNSFRKHAVIFHQDQLDAPNGRKAESKKTWETTVTRVESWPNEATPLKTYNWLSYLYLVGDIILVLLPLYFILLGVAVVILNGKPTNDNNLGRKVEVAMQLGPTIFPILFAAIIGRSLKMIARYLAERGARLSTLELLMASQSVWGTIESQLLLQRLTVVGVNLLFLWSLSPLGGQASLRLMERGNMPYYKSAKLRYMTTGPAGTFWGLATTYEGNGKFADAGALYSAALLAPQATKTGPRDPWGNVKIPSLDLLNGSNADAAGWINIPSNISSPETFSSLVGLPIVGLPTDGTSDFNIESSYISVSCGPFNQSDYPGYLTINATDWPKMDELIPGQIWKNKSEMNNPFQRMGQLGLTTSFFIDTERRLSPKDALDAVPRARLDGFVGYVNDSILRTDHADERRDITFVSLYPRGFEKPDTSGIGMNIAKCSLSQHHVEVMIDCNRNQCAAKRVRKSLADTRPVSLTGFEHELIMILFAEEFPRAMATRSASSPTERFLANSSSFPLIQQTGDLTKDVAYVNLSLISSETFSRRLSLLWNTFYQLSVQPTGYFGNLPQNLSNYGPDAVPATDINVYLPSNLSATNHTFDDWWSSFSLAVEKNKDQFPFIGATVVANITTTQEIFVCNFAWLALLWVAAGTIFITGTISLWLKRKTLGPELFGFVTSMTYHNHYFKIPEGGSRLDAMERARLLRDVDVYVADVRGNEDVGHIALAAGVPLRKLERGRLYS
ncbi:hypothetical protein CC78DRAFT_573352 [Lojkania enalia]|uniref:Uncharacterized protein n=1 Tax=Lojkania enalia TaxID=147567 RepID=A0A9P4TRI0_9PLEO|nr:hypothetical protein CC78DRAFT_573352 [Didymosphaeria enalia]